MGKKLLVIFSLIISFLVLSTQLAAPVLNNKYILRRTREHRVLLTEGPIPATSHDKPTVLDAPTDIALLINEETLPEADALLRMLAGDQDIGISHIAGITPKALANFLSSNDVHGRWRGMTVEAKESGILLNGAFVPVSKDFRLIPIKKPDLIISYSDLAFGLPLDVSQQLEELEDSYLIQAKYPHSVSGDINLFSASTIYPGERLNAGSIATDIATDKENPSFVNIDPITGKRLNADSIATDKENLSFVNIDPIIGGVFGALETLVKSIGLESVINIRAIAPGGGNKISLDEPAIKLSTSEEVIKRLGLDGLGLNKIDIIESAASTGGTQISIQVDTGDSSLTTDDLNKALAENPLITVTDPHDVIVSSTLTDIDKDKRLTGPQLVVDSQSTEVINGIATINLWVSDYGPAQDIINRIKEIAKTKSLETSTSEGEKEPAFIPAVARDEYKAKEQVVDEPIQIGIHGAGGRIGTATLLSMIGNPNYEVRGLVGIRNVEEYAARLRNDTVRGSIHADIHALRENGRQFIIINGRKIECFGRYNNLTNLPWEDLEVETVFETTGQFKTKDELMGHIQAGAEKVVLSVPPKSEEIPQIVPGVNHVTLLDNESPIVSCASCTTNNSATALSVVTNFVQTLGLNIKSVDLTTIHAITGSQRPLDGQNTKATNNLAKATYKAERGAASAANTLITTTGAKKAVPVVLGLDPAIFSAKSIRTGNTDGSVTEMTVTLEENVPFTEEELIKVFKEAAEGDLNGILNVREGNIPLDSLAILMIPETSVIDATQIRINGKSITFKTWYDNEIGYTQQMVNLALMMRMLEENTDITSAEELINSIRP